MVVSVFLGEKAFPLRQHEPQSVQNHNGIVRNRILTVKVQTECLSLKGLIKAGFSLSCLYAKVFLRVFKEEKPKREESSVENTQLLKRIGSDVWGSNIARSQQGFRKKDMKCL